MNDDALTVPQPTNIAIIRPPPTMDSQHSNRHSHEHEQEHEQDEDDFEEAQEEQGARPQELPKDLPRSLDDRQNFNSYNQETEYYDAWAGG